MDSVARHLLVIAAMRLIGACLALGAFFAITTANAEEKLPILKASGEVYSNVTVTSVSATDVYFTYSGGIGNAKLKNLAPEWQQHFKFNPTNATAVEKSQVEATEQYKRNLAIAKVEEKDSIPEATFDAGDVVAPKIFAHSFRGQRPPPIVVDRWLTEEPPKLDGKFVLVFMWLTSAEQCRSYVPQINDLADSFKERMVTIGLSNEPLEEMLKMKEPKVHFFTGTDTHSRTFLSYGITMAPHLVLIDPSGIVRYEGPPMYLNDERLAHLLKTYAQ
jgi:cytochrome c biogenesis protein CcmG/thiol:disulfide interchange protein DsbE